MIPEVDPRIAADFRNFLYLAWKFLRLPDPTPVQYDIADYLQHGPRRRMIEAFRGVGKSWITAAYVLWRLYINPNERVLVVSASKDRADAFSTFTKRLIAEWPLIQHLQPEPGMRDSNIAFDVGGSDPHQAPSVRSVGITGQMTGGRATVIVADDVETPKNALTSVMRERLSEAVKEFDAVLVPDGEIIYLGTPQTEMSLYNALPERGYDVRVWPARYPTAEKLAKYADTIAPKIIRELNLDPTRIGHPTDPKRFTDIDLMEREASYGRSGFALQFMLDTSLSDQERYPLRLSDLIVMGITPDLGPVSVAWGSGPDQLAKDLPVVGLAGDKLFRPMFVSKDFVPYQGCVMCIDPSGRGNDRTGYAVVAMLNGFLYLLAAGGLKGGYDDEVLITLANIAKRHHVKWIRSEPNFGDGMFDKLFAPHLQRIYPCTIDPDPPRSSIQKEKRIIDTLEPVMNQHRLIVNESVLEADAKLDEVKHQLFWQLTRITRERGAIPHDDALDAVAMAVGYWVEQMDKDVQQNLDERKQQLLDAELEKFASQVFGGSPPTTNWLGNLR